MIEPLSVCQRKESCGLDKTPGKGTHHGVRQAGPLVLAVQCLNGVHRRLVVPEGCQAAPLCVMSSAIRIWQYVAVQMSCSVAPLGTTSVSIHFCGRSTCFVLRYNAGPLDSAPTSISLPGIVDSMKSCTLWRVEPGTRKSFTDSTAPWCASTAATSSSVDSHGIFAKNTCQHRGKGLGEGQGFSGG